ncbi:amidase [Betaproteobacteria bacterium GR16-43]|nr:amidase [Betaproteobacteria bacterium GR16-43]
MLLDNDSCHAFLPYPAVPVPNASDGRLAGLTFAAKDLFDVTGYPTGGGNPLMLALSGIKPTTAPTVQKLLDAGARFVGKTHTDELAFSMNGKNAHFGTPRNGAAPDRICGGSSCGSASAVSNNLCDFALGTDTGGSVRAPANHCGLYGIRPSHGRISLAKTLDLSPSLDTCGYLARDVATFARVSDVLLGSDSAPLPERVRLLRATDLWALLEAPGREALAPAAMRIEGLLGTATAVTATFDSLDSLYWNFRYVQGREAWLTDGPFIERHAPPLGPGVADRFAWAKGVTDAQFEEGTAYRARFVAHMEALLGNDGVLLMPTMPDVAPLLTDSEAALENYRNLAIRMLSFAGLARLPQVSLPLASRLGAPLGISLLGPRGSDRSLVALAETIAA